MSTDAIWRAFTETGDPVYYMLFKSVQKQSGGKEQPDGARRESPSGE